MRRALFLLVILGLALAQQQGGGSNETGQQQSGYQITLAPTPVSIAPGGSAKSTLAVLPKNFTGILNISVPDLPPGVSYSPTTITVDDPNKNATVDITFTAAANAEKGAKTVNIMVGNKSFSFSLIVDPAAEPPSQNLDLENIWEEVQNWGSTACKVTNTFGLESVRWACTVYRTLERVVEMWDEVRDDFDMLKREGFVTAVGFLGNALGAELGLAEGNLWADQLSQDFLNLRRNYHQMTAKISNWMARVREQQIEAIRNNPYPENTPSWWRIEAIKLNPNLRAAQEVSNREKEMIAKMTAQAQEVAAAAEGLVEKSKDRAQQEMFDALQVTRPDALPGQEGEAEEVVRRAREANSTREVLEVLVDAQAKIMRQNLANTQNIVQALRESAVQQAYTTRQLANLIEVELGRQAKEVDAWEAEVERVMDAAMEEAENQAEGLKMVANLAYTVACLDGVLVPDENGEMTCVSP